MSNISIVQLNRNGLNFRKVSNAIEKISEKSESVVLKKIVTTHLYIGKCVVKRAASELCQLKNSVW